MPKQYKTRALSSQQDMLEWGIAGQVIPRSRSMHATASVYMGAHYIKKIVNDEGIAGVKRVDNGYEDDSLKQVPHGVSKHGCKAREHRRNEYLHDTASV